MVQSTGIRYGVMKTFGLANRSKKIYNHRKEVRHHRFQDSVDSEELVAHYSRDDIDTLDPRVGQRTYKDAQESVGRKNFILPNLSVHDLEVNELFQRELERQRAIIARVNKIRVVVDSKPGKGTEIMVNKDISTPHDCAKHIHELLTSRTVVAELFPLDDGSEKDVVSTGDDESTSQDAVELSNANISKPTSLYWDMHRPLEDSCRIKFRHFSEEDVSEVNKIYWRSCSFILGMAIRLAFKDDIKVLLHSWPKPNIKSGSFVYDAALNLSDVWQPTEQELRAFTKIMWNIRAAALPFERLRVDRDVAMQLFAKNPFKMSQVDSILENDSSQGKVTIYRCGGLLDMSVGPMIANTSQVGRITLASVHNFESSDERQKGVFYRFQGVSLPQQLPLSSFLYQNVLINQAKKLNKLSL